MEVYAVWYTDPDSRLEFRRAIRVTDETDLDLYRDCHIFLTQNEIEKHILKVRETMYFYAA